MTTSVAIIFQRNSRSWRVAGTKGKNNGGKKPPTHSKRWKKKQKATARGASNNSPERNALRREAKRETGTSSAIDKGTVFAHQRKTLKKARSAIVRKEVGANTAKRESGGPSA